MAFLSYPARFKFNPTVRPQKVARVSELGRPVSSKCPKLWDVNLAGRGRSKVLCKKKSVNESTCFLRREKGEKLSRESAFCNFLWKTFETARIWVCVCMVKFCNAVFVFYWNLCCSDTYVVVLAGFFSYTILWIEETFRPYMSWGMMSYLASTFCTGSSLNSMVSVNEEHGRLTVETF